MCASPKGAPSLLTNPIILSLKEAIQKSVLNLDGTRDNFPQPPRPNSPVIHTHGQCTASLPLPPMTQRPSLVDAGLQKVLTYYASALLLELTQRCFKPSTLKRYFGEKIGNKTVIDVKKYIILIPNMPTQKEEETGKKIQSTMLKDSS